MRLLLLAAACLACSSAFPMCTNGSTPLMEANDAFTCDRGCPLGFNCEFQDADQSMSKAICCPNMTALQQLYGDEEHSEPIWDLSQVADLSAGLQSAIEGASKTRDVTISAEDTLSSQEHTSADSAEAVTQAVEVTTDIVTAEPIVPIESTIPVEISETTTEAATSSIKTDDPKEETTVLSKTGYVEEPKGAISTASTAANDNTTSASTTLATVNVIVEIEGSGDGLEEPLIFQKKSCARQKFSLTCHDGKVKTQATIRWFKNADTGECEFYPFGYCPGDRIIESVTIRTRTECEEHCVVGKLDMQVAEIEPALTDSSKFNAAAGGTTPTAEGGITQQSYAMVATGLSTEGSSTSSTDSTTSLVDSETSSSQLLAVEKPNVGKNFESVNSTETTSSSLGTESTTAQYEPNDSSSKLAIEDPIAEQKQEAKNHLRLIPSTPTENTTKQEIDSNTVKQLQPPLSESQEKMLSGVQHPDKAEQGTGILETASTQETMAEEGPNSTKNITEDEKSSGEKGEDENLEVVEGISARNEVVEKLKVACSSGTYRYVCDNGHPSQFVYRWENVGGFCQSFPYGYCYGEFNHPHPRTMDECQQYCFKSPSRVFAL